MALECLEYVMPVADWCNKALFWRILNQGAKARDFAGLKKTHSSVCNFSTQDENPSPLSPQYAERANKLMY